MALRIVPGPVTGREASALYLACSTPAALPLAAHPMKPPSPSTPAAVRLLAAALLAVFASPALAATSFKMRVPVGPIVAAAPAPDISIAGYNPLTGMFQSPIGSFTWDGTSYLIPSGTAFGITGPVTLTPAATADAVKTAIRNNPTALGGTLAEGWTTGQGLGFFDDQWWRDAPGFDPAAFSHAEGAALPDTCTTSYCNYGAAIGTACRLDASTTVFRILYISGSDVPPSGWSYVNNCAPRYAHMSPYIDSSYPGTGWLPFAPGDFDGLPDPTPAAGAELPYAPYMPSGVAIQNNFTITDLNTGTVHHCTNGGCD